MAEQEKHDKYRVQAVEDAKKLPTVFPLEIWHEIIVSSKDVSIFQKARATSPLFREWFDVQRTRVLFPEVASILFRANPRQPGANKNCFGLSKTKLIIIRQVCCAWMQGADVVLQNQELRFKFLKEPYFKNMNFDNGWKGTLQTMENFADFEKHFDATHLLSSRNPFHTRDLVVSINRDSFEQKLDSLVSFLEKYGKHLWYCKFDFFVYSSAQPVYLYQKLPSILERIPSVKVFVLKLSTQYPYRIEDLLIHTSSFPTLPSIQFMYLKDIPHHLFHSLMENAANLHQVEILGSDPKSEELTKFCLERMHNLKNLSLRISNNNTFEAFGGAEAICHLEKLELIFHNCYVPWIHIFAALEKHCERSLTALTLKLPMGEATDISQSLKLPKLQRLRLTMDKPEPLDFLLPMKENLEELEILLTDLNENSTRAFLNAKEQENVVKFYTYNRFEQKKKPGYWHQSLSFELVLFPDIYKSNLWELFGKLKKLKFDRGTGEIRICNREQWKKAQGNCDH